MEEDAAAGTRSIGPALVSAATTFALFAAANWSLAGLTHVTDGEDPRWFRLVVRTFSALSIPLLTLIKSVENAVAVWAVKRGLKKRGNVQLPPHASINIITLCPLFIQLPPSTSHEPHQLHQICCSDKIDISSMETPPLQLQAAPALAHDATQAPAPALANNKCQQVLHINIDDFFEAVAQREALLASGIAPPYQELSFLRARNRFQALITALQAGGYIFSVIERMAQHLAITPLEAILSMYAIHVVLQLMIEPYACGHYQRPLLLQLTPDHLSRVRSVLHGNSLDSFGYITYQRCRTVVAFVFFLAIIAASSLSYGLHYLHSHFMCSLSVFFFLLSQFFVFVLIARDTGRLVYILLLMVPLLVVTSIILALVCTIRDWKVFDTPTEGWFDWILPHVQG